MNDIEITVVQHPKGALMQIRFLGFILTLDREEAIELYNKLNEKLPEIPVKV